MKKPFEIIAVSIVLWLQAGQPGFAADEKPVSPIRVAVTCDKTEYMHGQPGARYVIAPTGRLTATLTVKNVSNVEQTISFNSGQTSDFVIRDAKGNEVKRWSDGMMFTQALSDTKIAAGKEQVYKEQLELGSTGKPLPQGDYTLEGVLTCSPPVSSTRVPFKIISTPVK